MAKIAVKVIGGADGKPTPHDGRFVAAWNPHVRAGILELTSTTDPRAALIFDSVEDAAIAWTTISKVQRTRPWDKHPNKPLTRVTVQLINLRYLED